MLYLFDLPHSLAATVRPLRLKMLQMLNSKRTRRLPGSRAGRGSSDGNSIRATCRITAEASGMRNFLVDAGRACAAYQDEVLRNFPCKRVQADK
jgi:hypothetical protein